MEPFAKTRTASNLAQMPFPPVLAIVFADNGSKTRCHPLMNGSLRACNRVNPKYLSASSNFRGVLEYHRQKLQVERWGEIA